MNKLNLFLHWISLYILVILLVASLIWEESLSTSSINHKILQVPTLIFAGYLFNQWITQHEIYALTLPYEKHKEGQSRKSKDKEKVVTRCERTL
jgi:hypothetical protein